MYSTITKVSYVVVAIVGLACLFIGLRLGYKAFKTPMGEIFDLDPD